MNYISVSIVVFAYLASNWGISQTSNKYEGAEKTAAALYDLIRGITFPEHPLLDNEPNRDNRFILMMPGKILNYFDYYPGKDYTTFVQEHNTNSRESTVPPHIMEKWFDLADVMPSANPLFGQDSGRSLANEYTAVLRQTTVTNLKQEGKQNTSAYDEAMAFLKEELVPDPEDKSVNTTRLSLYERYRDQYNDRKLEMEDQIQQKKTNLRSLEYDLWFQGNYRSLLSKVESAFIRWVVFGEKDECDLYITTLNRGTPTRKLDAARGILRSFGVSSLDRTRTIYPVSFEPSDWYKYLLPKYQEPSQSQLISIHGRISAKIDVINNMIKLYNQPNSDDHLYSYRTEVSEIESNISAYVRDCLNAQLDCMYQNLVSNKETCEVYDQKKEQLLNMLSASATAMANHEDYMMNPSTRENFLKYFKNEKQKLIQEKDNIADMIQKGKPFIDSILNANHLAITNIHDSYEGDNWLQFSFDSKSTLRERESRTMNFYRGRKVELVSSKMKARGKLLRVNMKRQWFRPEIFEDSSLTYVEGTEQGSKTYVAPGKDMTEEQFIAALNGSNGEHLYRLPEYVTSFLLARDIELEFSEVDIGTVRSTLVRHPSSYLFFDSSSTMTQSAYKSQISVQRIAKGMEIKIPGAQLIGYYTQKLPRFPYEQK